MSKVKILLNSLPQILQDKALLLVLLLAFLLRLPLLSGSFWLDEAAQALESSRPLSQQYRIVDDFQPPLLHYIVHFLLIVSRDEMWLRSVSVISGLITIAALYALLRIVSTREVAVGAVLLLAINPFHIFFSQELRPYSLATMFAALSWWALLTYSASANTKRKKNTRSIVYFVLATIGGLYSMYIYPFVLMSQLLYVFVEHRHILKIVLRASFAACLFFLPWMPFFLGQLRAGTSLAVTLPGWSHVVATPQIKALPLVFAKFIVGQVNVKDYQATSLAIVFVLVILFLGIRAAWREKRVRFLLFWLLIPILGAWIVSFVVPVIQPKRVMVSLPAMMGLLGYWIWGIGYKAKVRNIIFACIAVIFLFMTWMYFKTPSYQREDWRGVIAMMTKDAQNSHSIAVFAFPESFAPWRWYAHGGIDSVATGRLHVESVTQVDVPLQPVLSLYPRVYVFDYLQDLSDPRHVVTAWLVGKGYRQTKVIDGGNVGFVRVYSSL